MGRVKQRGKMKGSVKKPSSKNDVWILHPRGKIKKYIPIKKR